MSDSESISSDNSNDAIFSNDFIKSILDDSDSSENEDNYDMNPVKNNPNDIIFITTLFNKHFGHNLNITACHFETSKAFTKPMLKDIEW
ncbi:15295_t:CDS:2, partial [Rhizophagus irregularis]